MMACVTFVPVVTTGVKVIPVIFMLSRLPAALASLINTLALFVAE
jgi:hypothetical protein